jgi:alkylation response protein AidB-like acyl-CoA dehydrogenase
MTTMETPTRSNGQAGAPVAAGPGAASAGTGAGAGAGWPRPARPDDDRFVGLAATVGGVAAEHAAEHDRENTWVAPAYEAMAAHGYLRMAVPEDLGGGGATVRQACYAQVELARHDGAAALAAAMHTYNVLAQVFRRAAGAPDAEGVLRRVAGEGLVVAASGGSDWLWPTTVATPVEGGFRVSGRKVFCSQSPAAAVLATSAVVGEPGPGAEVLHFSVPMSADGIRIEETWDTLGMRGTSSHDVVFDEVLVPTEKVVGRRPWGTFGKPLMLAASCFAPVAAATYLGIAAGARDVAVAAAGGRSSGAKGQAAQARVQRAVGAMDADLAVAWWAILGAADTLMADGPGPSTLATVMIAKRAAVTSAAAIVERAAEVAGGSSYFRRSPLERAWRDVRAGAFHPLTPEATLAYAGQLALGGDGSSE